MNELINALGIAVIFLSLLCIGLTFAAWYAFTKLASLEVRLRRLEWRIDDDDGGDDGGWRIDDGGEEATGCRG